MNKIITIFAVFATLLLTGCATPMQGGLLGAAVGNAITHNTRGTVVGGLVGAVLSGNQQQVYAQQPQRFVQGPQYGQQFNQGNPQCNPGDQLVYQNGQPRCQRSNQNNGYSGNNQATYIDPNDIRLGNVVCGDAAFRSKFPTVAISGTNCRRVQ